MPTVDEAQRAVETTLNAVFHRHIILLGIVGQEVQHTVVHTVGTCAYHQAHHLGMTQGLVVAATQHIDGGIGVAVGLKISQIYRCRTIAVTVESNALVELATDSVHPSQIRRAESLVGTKGATAGSLIGTGESGVYRQFLYACPETLTKIVTISIVSHLGFRYFDCKITIFFQYLERK